MAQEGKDQIGIYVTAGNPVGIYHNFHAAPGFELKGLHGIGKSTRLTLTTGYNEFRVKRDASRKERFVLVPLLAGLRFTGRKVYVEPAIGFGFMDHYWTPYEFRNFGLSFAAMGGIEYKNFDFALGYQQTGSFAQVLFKIGYELSMNSGK